MSAAAWSQQQLCGCGMACMHGTTWLLPGGCTQLTPGLWCYEAIYGVFSWVLATRRFLSGELVLWQVRLCTKQVGPIDCPGANATPMLVRRLLVPPNQCACLCGHGQLQGPPPACTLLCIARPVARHAACRAVDRSTREMECCRADPSAPCLVGGALAAERLRGSAHVRAHAPMACVGTPSCLQGGERALESRHGGEGQGAK